MSTRAKLNRATVPVSEWEDKSGQSIKQPDALFDEPSLKVYRMHSGWEWNLTVYGRTATKGSAKHEADRIALAVQQALCPEHERHPEKRPWVCRHCGVAMLLKVT